MCAAVFLVKTNDFIGNSIEENSNGSAEFSSHTNDCKRGAVAVMSAPLVVVNFAIFPHFFKLGIGFVGLIQARKHNRNTKEHKEFVLEIFFEHGLGDVIKIAGNKALFADKKLMRVSLNDSRLLHRANA